MVLGGGGSPSPGTEVLVQLGFAAAVLAWVWGSAGGGGQSQPVPMPLLWFGTALLVLPLVQLVPLPPAIWQSLPARELERATLALVGQEESWRPLSIAPAQTRAALLALIPAVGVMWAMSVLAPSGRRLVIHTIALLALAGALLGALQMTGGPDAFRLYEKTHRGWLTAFHANRNAAADVLLIGTLALSAWFARSARSSGRSPRYLLPLFLAGQAVLVTALVLTGSRTGIALAFVILPFHWLMLRPGQDRWRKRSLFTAGAVAALVLAIFPMALGGNSRLARVAQRFDASSDARFPLWQDTLDAVAGYWPAGSGVGTFPAAFQPFESLAYLDPFFPNRAHNDYLEFLLEAGVLALPLLAGGLYALVVLARRAWKLSPQDHAAQLFAAGTLAIVALHSLVDYPLRNMAIACLAGVAAGLLTVAPRSGKAPAGKEGREHTE